MNERIRDLLKQATKEVWGNNDYNGSPEFEGYEVDQEKFAELIVKECEKVAKDRSWYYDAPSCGWRNPINHVCNVMKEHFGVKR